MVVMWIQTGSDRLLSFSQKSASQSRLIKFFACEIPKLDFTLAMSIGDHEKNFSSMPAMCELLNTMVNC